ncbi:MAG TPA: molybdenum cofactor guanylyltransferase [Candidatus Dormibacteraeota bacterium]|nr:molybdenum cofactor guanylyltransferase [Candidatus Dormibacteraeota bacterium]
MTRPTVTAIVLAGGRASRFGGQKLEADIDGEPLLGLAVGAVAQVADQVLIAGPEPRSMAGLGDAGPLFIPDALPFEGPLVAIGGALRHATGELAIVVGGDMPRLVPSVLESMLDRLASDEAVDAVTLEPRPGGADSQARIPTLPLAMRITTTIAVVDQAIEAGDRSLIRLLGRLRSTGVPASDWLALDPDGRTLLDVDRPADLDRITRELR